MRIKECAQIFEQMEQQDDEQRAKTFQRFVEMAVEEWRDNNNTRECSEVTDLLRHLDSSMTMESSNESQMELISDQEIANFNIKYRALIESIINALTQEGLSVKTYYNRLFNALLKVCEGKKSIEKGICLYDVIWDKRCPYYEIEKGLILSEEDFRKTVNAVEPQLKKMTFILNLSYSQRTEEASRLLSVMNELDSTQAKSVFLAQLLNVSRKNLDS